MKEAHKELLQIHKIVMCIAECPPIQPDDTYTVKAVKVMAERINNGCAPRLDAEGWPKGLRVSMAMRLRHDFGIMSDEQKRIVLADVDRIFEELSGNGFYKPENEKEYLKYYPTTGAEGE